MLDTDIDLKREIIRRQLETIEMAIWNLQHEQQEITKEQRALQKSYDEKQKLLKQMFEQRHAIMRQLDQLNAETRN